MQPVLIFPLTHFRKVKHKRFYGDAVGRVIRYPIDILAGTIFFSGSAYGRVCRGKMR